MASLASQILFFLQTEHFFLPLDCSTYSSSTFQNYQEENPRSLHFCDLEEFSLAETEGSRLNHWAP